LRLRLNPREIGGLHRSDNQPCRLLRAAGKLHSDRTTLVIASH
jgi:hypothetical protein